MKRLYLLLIILPFIKSYGQVIADPTINQVSFTSIAGNIIPDTLPLGYVALLNIPIQNQSSTNILPAGSCKIKIGLGTKMILDPTFNLNLASTSQYFAWTAELNSGQIQITGELIVDLPANFSDTAKFNIQGSTLDYSTVSTNFLITNHNSTFILSDEDPSNNSSFRPYKIIPPVPIPVNFTSLFAAKKDCDIEVVFTTANEINVKDFQIEVSKDGTHFNKAGSVAAANLASYKFRFSITAAISSPVLYVRIKSIDNDGTYKYSSTKMLNAECKGKISWSIYPNPIAASQSFVTVRVSGGLLNGKYNATLYDAIGRLVSVKEFRFANEQQFNYPISNIAAGKYLMKIINTADGQSSILELQKL